MNVLFILTETLRKSNRNKKSLPLATQEDIPLGISYIASVLEKHNHKVDLYVTSNTNSMADLDEIIRIFKPEVIGFSMVYREFYSCVKILRYLKCQYPNIYVFAGGAHCTLNPEAVIEAGFDAVCIGEGEYPVLELVEQLAQNRKPSNINNFWFRTDDRIEKNDTRAYICNLDELPFPNRRLWQKYIEKKEGMHVILVGRGCPYNCTYCCNHALRSKAPGQYVRFRSPENIVEEIKSLKMEFPEVDSIFLETEAINLDINFLEALADKLCELNQELDSPIAFGANIRMHRNMDIPRVIKQFVKGNIVVINIGLESGSERVRKEILNRPEYTNDDLRLMIKNAKKYHRHIMIFALLGLPGETLSECRETVEIVKECHPNFIHLGIFTPYPGTVLYNKCVEDKLIDPATYKEIGRHRAAFNTQYMTKRQIEREYYTFFPKVYAKNRREYLILLIIFWGVYKLNWTFLAKYGLKYLK